VSLFNQVINQLVGGAIPDISKFVKFGEWVGSHNGVKGSLTVDQGKSKITSAGVNLKAHFEFTETGSGASHVLDGELALPNKTVSVKLDGNAVADGVLVVVGHTVFNFPTLHERAEFLFKVPIAGNPGNHYRFDADVSKA